MFILRIPSQKSLQLRAEDLSFSKFASSSSVAANIKNSDEVPASTSLSLARTDADFAAAETLLLLSGISPKKQDLVENLAENSFDLREFRTLTLEEQQGVKEFVYECIEKGNMTQKAAHLEVMNKYKIKVSIASISEWARGKGLKGVRQKTAEKLKPKVIKMSKESSGTYTTIADKLKLHPGTVRRWIKNSLNE